MHAGGSSKDTTVGTHTAGHSPTIQGCLHLPCTSSKCAHLLVSVSRLPVLDGSVQQTKSGLLLQPHHHCPGRRESGQLCLHSQRQDPHFPDTLPASQLRQHFFHTHPVLSHHPDSALAFSPLRIPHPYLFIASGSSFKLPNQIPPPLGRLP